MPVGLDLHLVQRTDLIKRRRFGSVPKECSTGSHHMCRMPQFSCPYRLTVYKSAVCPQHGLLFSLLPPPTPLGFVGPFHLVSLFWPSLKLDQNNCVKFYRDMTKLCIAPSPLLPRLQSSWRKALQVDSCPCRPLSAPHFGPPTTTC